jgi:HAD superfamily hydrolase (TIGR01490 family)
MKIAAFFDLDGTLLPAPSLERRFFWFALWQRRLHFRGAFNWLGESVELATAAFRRQFSARFSIFDTNKCWTEGIPITFCAEWARREAHSLGLFTPALARVEWHLAQRHKVFLVSGSLAPLIRAAAEFNPSLAKFEICATELELSEGKFTGHTSGTAMCGPEKARAAARVAALHEIDLSSSYAYANSSADRWILAAVGRPFAVNPDRGLAHLAEIYGWPVLSWNSDRTSRRLCQPEAPPHPIFRGFAGRKSPWA